MRGVNFYKQSDNMYEQDNYDNYGAGNPNFNYNDEVFCQIYPIVPQYLNADTAAAIIQQCETGALFEPRNLHFCKFHFPIAGGACACRGIHRGGSNCRNGSNGRGWRKYRGGRNASGDNSRRPYNSNRCRF